MKISSVLCLAGLCVILSGCSTLFSSKSASIKGSGKIVSEARSVSHFDRVSVSGSGHLAIVQGDQEGLTIQADDNLLPLLKSEVADGELKISPEHKNLKPTQPIQYQLQLKELKALHLSGALGADAPTLHTDQLLLGINGAGNIKVPKLEAGNLEVQVNGSGDIEVAGRADRQTVNITGAGNYQAGQCEGQQVLVHVTGSGNATVWPRQALDAAVTGCGDIKYYGAPQLTSHVTGAGSIGSLGSK